MGRGGKVIAQAQFAASCNHGVELLPTVSRLCTQAGIRPADVGRVDVSGGPGSFTGLRVGVTFAKSLAYAHGARLVRMGTLDVIAQNALTLSEPPPRVAVILDAKRKKVFANWYELKQGTYVARDRPLERDPIEFLGSIAPIAVLGEGVGFHRGAVDSVNGVSVLDESLNRGRAEVVFELGESRARRQQWTPIEEMAPIYVRLAEAEEKWRANHPQH